MPHPGPAQLPERAPPGPPLPGGAGAQKNLRPDSMLMLLRLWASHEKQQPNRHLVAHAPAAGAAPARPHAASLLDPPKPPPTPQPWQERAEEQKGGACVKLAVATAVAHTADLQLKLFSVVVRARLRGLPLPPLPPHEAGLLLAVEAAAGQRTSATWRQVALELQEEGARPVAADLARLEAQASAGQRQVEFVWATQAQLQREGRVATLADETKHFAASVSRSHTAGLAATTAPHGKLSIEQRSRGRRLKAAMMARPSKAELTPYEIDAMEEAQKTMAFWQEREAKAALAAASADGAAMAALAAEGAAAGVGHGGSGVTPLAVSDDIRQTLAARTLQATARGRAARTRTRDMRRSEAEDLVEYAQILDEVQQVVAHARASPRGREDADKVLRAVEAAAGGGGGGGAAGAADAHEYEHARACMRRADTMAEAPESLPPNMRQ